jgi:hypothetical protein
MLEILLIYLACSSVGSLLVFTFLRGGADD